jgi:uroporphyrinogen decarboxylase
MSVHMSRRERMLTAISGGRPDVLPVTTHHLMSYYLRKKQNGISNRAFFEKFDFEQILWHIKLMPRAEAGEYLIRVPEGGSDDSGSHIVSDRWNIRTDSLEHQKYPTNRFTITTPVKQLSMCLQSNEYTSWITEHLIKEPEDIELIEKYAPSPAADTESVLYALQEIGDRGIVRSQIPSVVDIYGQPGCWQDACCLVGTEKLILATYDDPAWVHELLGIIQRKKLAYIKTLRGAAYDLIELGGGDGSTSVVSPAIFDEFVAPYDQKLIEEAHRSKQKIVYHLCGKKMAILDSIGEMGMDVLETLTPPEMGGDAVLPVIKEKLGGKMSFIGGFDQNHLFVGASEEETRAGVRKCFREIGMDGGYIISPSDHFFDAEDRLLYAFVDEAHKQIYKIEE